MNADQKISKVKRPSLKSNLDLSRCSVVPGSNQSISRSWYLITWSLSRETSITIPKSLKGNTDKFYQFGGSPIGNSRVKLSNMKDCIKNGYIKENENPLVVASEKLIQNDINILHIIGGDDTNMRETAQRIQQIIAL